MPADKIDVARLAREADEYADAAYPDRSTGRTREMIRDEHFALLVLAEAAKVAEHTSRVIYNDVRDEIAAAIRARMP
jgi:hypothetical protein